MANEITLKELQDARVDVKDLGEALNESKVISPRYGGNFKSLPLAIQEVVATGGFEPFETELLLKSSVPTLVKKAAYALDTHKIWLWKDGAWTNTGFGVIDQANKYTNKKLESYVENEKVNQLKIFSGTGVYPFFTDIDNRVLLGYDANKDALVGLISETSGSSSDNLPFAMAKATTNAMVGYGQSLSTGVRAGSVLSTTQPFNNITFASGVRGDGGVYTATKPLVEDNAKPTPDGEADSGETFCSGAANYASLSAYLDSQVLPSEHVIFSSTAGHGGYVISQLAKGSAWYNSQFLSHLNGIKTLKPDSALQAVLWAQGETNMVNPAYTKAEHYTSLIQLQKDVEADAKSIFKQSTPTLFLTYQHSTLVNKGTHAVPLAILDACQKSDRFYFVAPTYFLPHAFDNLHLSAVGYKWLGAYYGRAYKQAVVEGIKPKAIMPKGAVVNGKIVKVKFDVPHAPLVIDTATLKPTPDSGFSVFVDGADRAITSVTVADDEAIITLTNTPAANSSIVVKYALTKMAAELGFESGGSGNLRDSCTESCIIDGVTKPLFYVCPHFQLTAITEVI